MARKNEKSRLKMSGRTLMLHERRKASCLRSMFVFAASILILVRLVSWAVCSDAGEWRNWLGSLRATHLSFGSADDDDGEAAGFETGENQPRYQGSGRATLGGFTVDRFDPVTDTTLTVCFQLAGQTVCKGEEEFLAVMDENRPFFHKHVEGAVRDCEFAALIDEESLGRKVVVRVNRLLGRHFLQSVEFDELTIYETIGSDEPTIWKLEEANQR